jgi:hypothetical protein
MRRLACSTFAIAIFASLPLSLSWQASSPSLLPTVTTLKADAWTYRRARVTYRRAYRRAWRYSGPAYYAHQDGLGGYPYTAPNYAYRGVYAPPVAGLGWNRWGRGLGWGWGHHWGGGFGWGWHRGWRW